MELSELALHFEAKRSMKDDDFDEMQNYLYDRSSGREKGELEGLWGLFKAFKAVSFPVGQLPPEELEVHDDEGQVRKVLVIGNFCWT